MKWESSMWSLQPYIELAAYISSSFSPETVVFSVLGPEGKYLSKSNDSSPSSSSYYISPSCFFSSSFYGYYSWFLLSIDF